MICKRMPRANVGANSFECRKEFLRPPDAGECNNWLPRETFSLSLFRQKTRRENGFARWGRNPRHLGAALSRPDDQNRIDVPHLRGERRTQRSGGHAKPVAGADLAIDDRNREVRLDLPALQAIVEDEHARVDRTPRVPCSFDTVSPDDHRSETHE
jgi:hypothetical protein